MKFSAKKNIICFALIACLLIAALALVFSVMDTQVAFAAEEGDAAVAPVENTNIRDKAYGAAIAVAVVAAAGAIGMSIAISKAVEGISRQPEAESKIRTSLLLGLVFIETAIIYALIVAILIVFVL